MATSLEDVTKTAEQANIQIDQQEAEHYLVSLQAIFQLATQMASVDTTSVQPVAHPFGIPQHCRSDKITEVVQRDKMQQLTEHTKAGLYYVPPVIE